MTTSTGARGLRRGRGRAGALSCALALCLTSAPSAAPAGKLKIHWKDATFALEKLPADLPEPARSAVETWAAWAGAEGYRMDLDRAGLFLLISASGNSRSKRQLSLLERTAKLFERLMPAPERLEEPDEAALASSPWGALPEDPEEGPLPEDPEDEIDEPQTTSFRAATSWSTTWGAEDAPLDTGTVVIFVLRNKYEYDGILDILAEDHAYLAEWVETARGKFGFTLQQPLAGAYLEGASGQEEWNPENELVNRAARLLLMRRFGQQPHWLAQGWAWHVELTLLKAIYCFPNRSEFVGVAEHSDWDRVLRSRFAKRKDRPLTPEEFASWARGSYSDPHAKVAWGLVDFLVAFHAEALADIAEDLRKFRLAHNRVENIDGTWERDRDYDVPPAEQEAILERRAGGDVLAQASEFFRLGRDYEPGRE